MPARAISKSRFPREMIAGFVLLVAMVVASLAFALGQARDASRTARLFDYEQALVDGRSALKDAETGQRGYLLTNDRSYLAPYRDGRAKLPEAMARIRRLDLSPGKTTFASLDRLAQIKMAELRETVALAEADRRDAALDRMRTGFGKRTMDEIRAIVARERRQTRDALTQSQARVMGWTRWLVIGLAAGLIGIVILAIYWLGLARSQMTSLDTARGDAEASLIALRHENAAREKAETKVRQMQKMESVGQLTGGIAHDFNNMLAIVIGGLELAKRRMHSDPARAEACIDNAREGATRAAALTARLLAFSRSSPLAPVALDANRLVGTMSELLFRTLGETIAVETVLAAGLWRSYADAGELENAILNLAVNARDAMVDGGKLTIETANCHLDDNYARDRAEVEPGQYVMISVSDTGEGMAAETIARAFDPFFTTKAVGKGTGLGLSQVFGFAKQSGGHVAIYSEPGEGTTVKLYLPRFVGAAAEDAASSIHDESLPQGSLDEIVLVVEDEQRVRHFAVDVLRELGYSAISSGSPAEALRLLDETPRIALLFTDIVMPEMNGRRLADLARQVRPGLPVLYTTGYTRNAVVHNGVLDVGVAFLPKPYTIAELARKIREVIDGGGVNRPV